MGVVSYHINSWGGYLVFGEVYYYYVARAYNFLLTLLLWYIVGTFTMYQPGTYRGLTTA